MPIRQEAHAVDELEEERRDIMIRNGWPVSLMAFVDVPPQDVDRLREIQRLLRLPRAMRCSVGTDGAVAQKEIVIDRIERPETASELYQRLQPDSAAVSIDEAPSPPSFKVGDVVQLQSGGLRMTVLDTSCSACLELASGVGEIVFHRLPRAAVKRYDPLAADGPDIPF